MCVYDLGTVSLSSVVQGPDDLDLSLPRWCFHILSSAFCCWMCWNSVTKALGSGLWWPARGLAPGYAAAVAAGRFGKSGEVAAATALRSQEEEWMKAVTAVTCPEKVLVDVS